MCHSKELESPQYPKRDIQFNVSIRRLRTLRAKEYVIVIHYYFRHNQRSELCCSPPTLEADGAELPIEIHGQYSCPPSMQISTQVVKYS